MLIHRHVNQRWSCALQAECEKTWKINEDDDDQCENQWIKLNGRLCVSMHIVAHTYPFRVNIGSAENWIGSKMILHALRRSYWCASPSCQSPWSYTMMRVHPSSRLSDTSNLQRLRRVSTDPGAALPPSHCSRKQRVLPAARWQLHSSTLHWSSGPSWFATVVSDCDTASPRIPESSSALIIVQQSFFSFRRVENFSSLFLKLTIHLLYVI